LTPASVAGHFVSFGIGAPSGREATEETAQIIEHHERFASCLPAGQFASS